MCGFPNETEEEFSKTYKLLEKIKLYKIHVFQYSKREGTLAATFEGQVMPNIKEERSKKLIELSNETQRKYNVSYIGKEVDVLIEEKEDNFFKGHTKNYMQVKVISSNEDLKNRIVSVKVIDVQNEYIVAKLI